MMVEAMMRMVVGGLQDATDQDDEDEVSLHIDVLTYILDSSPDKKTSSWIWMWLVAKMSEDEEVISRALRLRKEEEEQEQQKVNDILDKLNINNDSDKEDYSDMPPLM